MKLQNRFSAVNSRSVGSGFVFKPAGVSNMAVLANSIFNPQGMALK